MAFGCSYPQIRLALGAAKYKVVSAHDSVGFIVGASPSMPPAAQGHLPPLHSPPLHPPRRLWVREVASSSATSSLIMTSPSITPSSACHVRRVRSRAAISRADYEPCSEYQRTTTPRVRMNRIRPTRLLRWMAVAVVVSVMITACHAQTSDSSGLGDTVSTAPTTTVPSPRPSPQPRPTTAPSPTTASPSPSPTVAPTPVETPKPTTRPTTRPTPTPTPETPEPTPEPTSRPAPSPAPTPPEPITPLPVPTPAPPSGVPTPSPVPKLTPGAGVEPTASPPPTASPSPIPTPPPLKNDTNVTTEPSVTPSSKPTLTPTPTPTPTSALKEASVKASTAPSSSGSKTSDAETSAVKGDGSTSSTLTMGLVIGSVAFVVVAAALFVYARVNRRGDDDDDKAEPRREARDLPNTGRNAPGYTQLSPVRQPPPQGQQPPSQGYGNRLSQLLGPKPLMTRSQDSPDSPPRYGDSVDFNDPAFDVLTPTSDIITVDPTSMASFSSDTSDHVSGFNSLTESGKPKMYRETNDDFCLSVSSAGDPSLTASSTFYTRQTGENDVSGDSDGSDSDNDDVDIDDADSQDDDIVGLHDSDLTPLDENPWLQTTDSMPRLISDTYTNVDDLHDSDSDSDGADDNDNYSDDGSLGSYASARTIDTSFSGFSDTNSGRRMESELFSDDGNEFDDRDPSYLDSNRGGDSSFMRPASDLSSGDEFHDSSDDDDDDDYTDLR